MIRRPLYSNSRKEPCGWEPRVEVAGHLAGKAQLGIKRRILLKHRPGRPDAQVGVLCNTVRKCLALLGDTTRAGTNARWALPSTTGNWFGLSGSVGALLKMKDLFWLSR
jgi:hypothetical protein